MPFGTTGESVTRIQFIWKVDFGHIICFLLLCFSWHKIPFGRNVTGGYIQDRCMVPSGEGSSGCGAGPSPVHSAWTADPKRHQVCAADTSAPAAALCYLLPQAQLGWALRCCTSGQCSMKDALPGQLWASTNPIPVVLGDSVHSVVWKKDTEWIFRTFSLTS